MKREVAEHWKMFKLLQEGIYLWTYLKLKAVCLKFKNPSDSDTLFSAYTLYVRDN